MTPCNVSGLVCHFFFQAEDGIRDYKVTGVQTCALPISELRRARGFPRAMPVHKQLPGSPQARGEALGGQEDKSLPYDTRRKCRLRPWLVAKPTIPSVCHQDSPPPAAGSNRRQNLAR